MSAIGVRRTSRFSPQRAPRRQSYCALSTPSLPQVSISWSCVKWHMLPDGGSARVASIMWTPTNHRQRTSAEAPRNIVFIFIESSSGSEEALDACLDHIPGQAVRDLAHTSRLHVGTVQNSFKGSRFSSLGMVAAHAVRAQRNVRYWPKADVGECIANVCF